MQPYDPDRRIILMIHGLASSPEAWVNVANELMGDERIRARFQVWQFYYPTNMPIAFNHYAMRQTLDEAVSDMAKYQVGKTLPESDVNDLTAFLETLTGKLNGLPLTDGSALN